MTRPPFIIRLWIGGTEKDFPGANTLPPAFLDHHFTPPVDRRKTKTPQHGKKKTSAAAIVYPPVDWRQQEERGRAFAPGLLSIDTRRCRVARAPPRRNPTAPARRTMRCQPTATHRIPGRLLTPSAHRANVLHTSPRSAITRKTRRATIPKYASHIRGRI